MITLTKKAIREAAKKKKFSLKNNPFSPKDLGIDSSKFGSFSDYCDNTKSSKYNKKAILTAVVFNKAKRPMKYKLA